MKARRSPIITHKADLLAAAKAGVDASAIEQPVPAAAPQSARGPKTAFDDQGRPMPPDISASDIIGTIHRGKSATVIVFIRRDLPKRRVILVIGVWTDDSKGRWHFERATRVRDTELPEFFRLFAIGAERVATEKQALAASGEAP